MRALAFLLLFTIAAQAQTSTRRAFILCEQEDPSCLPILKAAYSVAVRQHPEEFCRPAGAMMDDERIVFSFMYSVNQTSDILFTMPLVQAEHWVLKVFAQCR